MRKLMAVLMVVLALGAVKVYSATNSDYDFTSPFAITDDDDSSKNTVDPAPSSGDDILSISTNKGME